jgi:hypothetical protein
VPKDLAALLVEEGAAPADVVERALARQQDAGGALDTALLELGAIAEDALSSYLARAAELPPAPPAAWAAADPRARRVFPSRVAERHGLAPFALEGRELALVATYPVDLGLLDEISFMLSLHLTAHVGPEWRVRELIHRIYGSALPPRLAALAAAGGASPGPEVEPPEPELQARPEPVRSHVALSTEGFGDSDEPMEPLAAALAQALESVELELEAEMADEPAEADAAAQPAAEEVEEELPPPEPTALDRTAPPHWKLDDARAAIAAARHRDEVVLAALRYARDFFEFTAMFAVTRDAVAGHDALGEEGARERARAVAIWAADPGVFKTVIETQSPYLGPIASGVEGTDQVLQGLGRTPRTALVYPIVLRGRAVCILYADNGEAPVSARRLGDLLLFLATVGGTFERIIRDRKRRRRRTSARAAAPSERGDPRSGEPPATGPRAAPTPPLAPGQPHPAAPALAPPPAPSRVAETTYPSAPREEPSPPPSVPPPRPDEDRELSFADLEADSAPQPAPGAPAPPARGPASPAPGAGRTAPMWPAPRGTPPAALAPGAPASADSLAALEERFFSGGEAASSAPARDAPAPAPSLPEPPPEPKRDAAAPRADAKAPARPAAPARTPPPVATPPDPASLAGLADRALDADPEAAAAAVAALGNRRRDPAIRQATEKLRRALLSGLSARASRAARALGALRDADGIPLLIQVLETSEPDTARAAADALAAITLQRLGPDPRRWLAWWKENRGHGRAEWLFSGLTSPDRDVRVAASVELSHAAPPPVAYTADMPAVEREKAARAWAGWWARSGHVL